MYLYIRPRVVQHNVNTSRFNDTQPTIAIILPATGKITPQKSVPKIKTTKCAFCGGDTVIV